MDILEIINAKLSNVSIDFHEKALAIEEVENVIKNYCNINTVPSELKFTWANMAIDLLRYQHEANLLPDSDNSLDSVAAGNISSLKIGDTSINLGNEDSLSVRTIAMKSHSPNLDNLVMNYKSQLQRFRKMVW